MTSAFHRPASDGPRHLRRVSLRLHPALTDVLNRLDGLPLGQSFKDRAVELSTTTLLSEPVNRDEALHSYRWLLERAAGDGLPLTQAGYLKPADVQALAGVMPTMDDWIFAVKLERNAHPVWHFREFMKAVGLLRKYKGTLRTTRIGRECLADSEVLWAHLADRLLFTGSRFDVDASVVVLVHMATSDERLDVDAVARTLTELGWQTPDGSPVRTSDVYPVWNELWTAIGNVGPSAGSHRHSRVLSVAAKHLVSDALFETSDGASG